MRKKQFENSWKSVEVLGLKIDKYAYELQEKLNIYDISAQVSVKKIDAIINNVIEVEMEETEETEITRGGVYIKRNGVGKYYSIKNIHFHLSDFLDLGLNLILTETKYKIFVSAIFLVKLMERLGVDLEKEQTAVCAALHQATKQYAVTEENIIKCIVNEIDDIDYIKVGEDKIKYILLQLIEMRLISIENGRYKITEDLFFE